MATLSEWEKVRLEPLGSGGQSTVYLVRRPERKITRDKSFEAIKSRSGRDQCNSRKMRGHARERLLAVSTRLVFVEEYLKMIQHGWQLLKDGVPRPCRVCGVGFYEREKFERTVPRLDPNQTGLRFWSGAN